MPILSTASLAVAAIVLGSVLALLVGWWITPAQLAPSAKHGYRAARRAQATQSMFFRWIQIPLLLFAHFAGAIRRQSYRDGIQRRLVAAGDPLGLDVSEFIGLAMISAIVGAGIGSMATEDLGPAVVVALALVGFYYPHVWLGDAARKRLHLINKGLPYANDLLVLTMQAGIDFVGAVRQYVGKVTEAGDPISEEFSRILQELELGRTRRAALEAFAERAPTEPVKGFCMAVIQAEQRGTPVADALKIQSGVLRTHQSLQVEKLAGRAAVLVLLPLLLILISTILILFGGMIVRAMRGELL